MTEVQTLIRESDDGFLVQFFGQIQNLLGHPSNAIHLQKRNEQFISFLERGIWRIIDQIDVLKNLFGQYLLPSLENDWDDSERRPQIVITQSMYNPVGQQVK